MDNRYIKGEPLPAVLGLCGDLYREVRELRLAMQKEVDAVEARENEIEEHLISNISKSDTKGVVGLRFVTKVEQKEAYKVDNWGALHNWIQQNDRFDMLEKRLAKKAAADWVEENKKALPGTEIILVPTLSVTKI